ncbi:MAG: lipoprotein [Pseudomonadota bacterium]|nr:lipoprotein [Pseudomonadota bacterium]
MQVRLVHVIGVVLLLTLVGCGQKGPLYLPDTDTRPAHSLARH